MGVGPEAWAGAGWGEGGRCSQPKGSVHQAGFGEREEIFLVISASRCSQNIVGSNSECQMFCHARVGPVLFKMPGVFQLGCMLIKLLAK